MNKQPVTAGIVVTDAFRGYKDGIMVEENLKCSGDDKTINHAVTLVGFGKTTPKSIENSWCKEYWIARNSWGAQWGEQGNFKLCMDKAGREGKQHGACHINQFPSYPTS